MSRTHGPMADLMASVALVALAVMAGASLAQAAPATAPGVTADRVLLGQSAKITGTARTTAGRQYRGGLLLAFLAINRSGGDHGRKIDLVTLNDQNVMDEAVANMREQIEGRQVFALTGYTFTGSVRAALPMLKSAGISLVGAYTGTPDIYDGNHPMVFPLRASFADELAAISRHIDTVGYGQVAMVHYGDALDAELRDDIGRRLKRIGRALVVSGAMQLNAPEARVATATAVEVLAKHCPKLVILGVSGRDAAAVVQLMAASACPPVRFVSRSIIDIGILRQTLGATGRGVIITQVVPNPSRGLHPLVSEYRSLLKQRDAKARPDLAEFEGYIAGRCVVQAPQRSGRDLSRAGVIKAMESVTLDPTISASNSARTAALEADTPTS